MRNAVLVASTRTPIGRSHRGALVDIDAFELAKLVVGDAVGRSGISPNDIDDVVIAESLQGGGVIARNVLVQLGMEHIPGAATNRHCAAGLASVQIAAATIMAGMADVIVAGGTESLSSMPLVSKSVPASAGQPEPWMSVSHPDRPDAPNLDMSITVGENTARKAGVTREEADAWALRSHARAVESIDKGWFTDEIISVPTPDGSTFSVDEQPRRDTTPERLASLPLLHPEIDGAVVTAGNSAGLNDGAAAVVVTSDRYAHAHGLTPLARVVAWAAVGVDPAMTGLAPTIAIPKALDRAAMQTSDVARWEINEAFATMAVACTRELGLDAERVNTNGSGCSLGHPIAATGTRMVVTMINELRRRDETVGCVSMCAGGGMGSALVLERLA